MSQRAGQAQRPEEHRLERLPPLLVARRPRCRVGGRRPRSRPPSSRPCFSSAAPMSWPGVVGSALCRAMPMAVPGPVALSARDRVGHPFGVAGGDDDVRAVGDETLRGGETETAGCSSEDVHAAGESEIHGPHLTRSRRGRPRSSECARRQRAVLAAASRHRRTAASTRSSTGSRSSAGRPIARCSTSPSYANSRNCASVSIETSGRSTPGVALASEPLPGRGGERVGRGRPAGREVGVGAQPARHLELAAEPSDRVGAVVEQVAHDLDQPELADGRDHRGGVVFRHGDEQRFLVAEVVEDGTAGQPGLLLQDPHRGTLVAVAREAGPGAAEDLLASGFELVSAHSAALIDHLRCAAASQSVRTACDASPVCTGASRAGSAGTSARRAPWPPRSPAETVNAFVIACTTACGDGRSGVPQAGAEHGHEHREPERRTGLLHRLQRAAGRTRRPAAAPWP